MLCCLVTTLVLLIGCSLAPVTGFASEVIYDNVIVVCERLVDESSDKTICKVTSPLDSVLSDSWIGFAWTEAKSDSKSAMVRTLQSAITTYLQQC